VSSAAATVAKPFLPVFQSEILTPTELASWLKMSKRQVYELTRERGQYRQKNPLPILRINGNLRFRRSDVEAWLNQIAESSKPQ
jgi:excisionase family DNA binding protein